MVRKPKRPTQTKAEPTPPRTGSDRDKAIAALMELLAEQSFAEIGLAEVAGSAGIKLSQLRAEFGSTLAILGAHIKDIDKTVLAGGDADLAEETPRARRGAIPDWRWRSTPWRCARRSGCWRPPALARPVRVARCVPKVRR